MNFTLDALKEPFTQKQKSSYYLLPLKSDGKSEIFQTAVGAGDKKTQSDLKRCNEPTEKKGETLLCFGIGVNYNLCVSAPFNSIKMF